MAQFSNHSKLHGRDLKGRNSSVCRLRLYVHVYVFMYINIVKDHIIALSNGWALYTIAHVYSHSISPRVAAVKSCVVLVRTPCIA